MKEKDFQSKFSRWIRNHPAFQSSVFELKLVNQSAPKNRNKKLSPKRDFQPHQLPTLQKARHGCIYHKISDQSMGYKPFDAFKICNVPAYVAVMFYRPRKRPQTFILIPIDTFLDHAEKTKHKPISEQTALSLGEEYVL